MTVWTVPARVTRVVDGDTLICDLDLGWGFWHIGARVRLARINCPEMDTDEGKAAKTYAADILGLPGVDGLTGPGFAAVTLVSRKLDAYGRTLAEIKLADGRLLNDLLLDSGHAVVMKM